MILKIFNLKMGNRDRKTSDTLFMKKEHEQVSLKIKRYGHKDIVNIGICYPMHTIEIPILTSYMLLTNCL